MRNFDYLKDLPYLQDLCTYSNACEENQLSHPDTSALNARRALEWLVRSIYEMKQIDIPERASLFELMDGEPFKTFVGNDQLMMGIHYIRKVGNAAAHTGTVSKRESFFALLNLYNFVGAVLVKLQCIEAFAPFDKSLLPKRAEIHLEPKPKVETTPEFISQVDIQRALPTALPTVNTGISEADTRKYYIDIMLKEAGWDVLDTNNAIHPLKACIEIEVQGMPIDSGVGYADYVLFGANGKPLAVVEAKRTSIDAKKGRQQACLYADCLQQKYGVRPVIYYTNGYKTEIIDGLGYPNRPVYGYLTANDLELLIQRRNRNNITDLTIKDTITDRAYQKMAIKAVCEDFNKKRRKALLVMATGTGKTRTAISLVDVLMRNDWVKNVLFLADRTTLVNQAAKNFTKLLPNTTTCILSDNSNSNSNSNSKKDKNARILFSTYQTMINYIDTDTKEFSVGRFDLVIIDEAHRSVFGKFGAIFSYFDSLLVGLTATPREEIVRNTYELFELEDGEPTSYYELEEAVADGYLVPYRGLQRGSLILQEGIRYDSLSDEEKEQLEKIWEYEATQNALDIDSSFHRDIQSKEIFNYIFNINTIDKVLQDLITHGQTVQSGERIGKTIIFAYNHTHADLIERRFKMLYPEYGPDFCVLIDNTVNYAQSLIDKFEVRDTNPQITVSVDMLDTGVDVPDVLNLVFFKIVKSKIKFMQMIGRGTRLSPDIFGAGKDKTCFYIFDWCRNFEFFSRNPNGAEPKRVLSLTERLFNLRTDIAHELQHQQYQKDDFAKSLHDELKSVLHSQVSMLNDRHTSVREHWEIVDYFKKRENWIYISPIDVVQLKSEVTSLLTKSANDEDAKKFDLLALNVELSILCEEINADNCKRKIIFIAQKLQERATISLVQQRMDTIHEVLTPIFWENLTLAGMERVRKELRELLKLLKGGSSERFEVDIEDIITDEGEAPGIITTTTYKQRVIDFLSENRDLPILQKIFRIEPLNQKDVKELERILWSELGDKKDYDKQTYNMICGDAVAAFIRSIIGIDRGIALKMFSDFIAGSTLNAQQEEYLKTIITYVCENGDITGEVLVNETPFDSFDWLEAFGQNFTFVRKYIETLHKVVVA